MRCPCPLVLCLACCTAPPAPPAIAPAAHLLAVQPESGVLARRAAGGQTVWMSPAFVTLANRGSHAFPWLIEANAPWLGVHGECRGVVAPASSRRIELSIDAARAPTAPGRHPAELRVLNAMTFHCEARIEVGWIVAGDAGPPAGTGPDTRVPLRP